MERNNREEAKKFALAIVKYLFIIIVAAFFINSLYNNLVIEKKQLYRIEKDYLAFAESQNKNLKYGFFGDSHTNNGINPEFIPGGYNFAVGGQNYIKIYYRLVKVFDKDKVKIDTVVFGIDPHTFSSKFYDESFMIDNLWFWVRDFHFFKINQIKLISGKPLSAILINTYFPFVGNGRDFEVLFREDYTKIHLGWIADEREFIKENRTAVAMRDYEANFKGQTTQIIPIGLEHFTKAIKLAESNDAKIVFIRYPLSREYYNLLNSNNMTQKEYYDIVFNTISRTINNYTFLDYQDIYFEKPEFFADSAHLNPKGAEDFSKRVYEDLKKLEETKNIN